MDTITLPALIDADGPMLRLAVAAHLARYKGLTRAHAASDLKAYLRWCVEHDVMPLQAQRGHVELICAGSKKCDACNPPQSQDASPCLPPSTGPASSTGF